MKKVGTYSRKEFNQGISESMNTQHFDSRIKMPASDFLYTIMKMYPHLIDKNKIKELIETHVFMYQSEEENRTLESRDGYWLRQSIEDMKLEYNIGGLRLNNKLLEQPEETRSAVICHELLHMCSQNMGYVEIGDFSYESFGFNMNQASYIQGESELGYHSGQSLNEGFTEYLTEEVTRNCDGYKAFVTPDDSYYKPLVEISRILHAAGGDKVVESYFKGDSTIMINEFNDFLGQGSWKQFSNLVECIDYEPKRKREGLTVEQAKQNAKALLYEYYYNKDEKSFNEFFLENEIKPWIKSRTDKEKSESPLSLFPKQSAKREGMKTILKDYSKSNQKKGKPENNIKEINVNNKKEIVF